MDKIAIACHHLLWVWLTYGGGSGTIDDKNVILPHRNMSAGEDATEFLEREGYVVDKGWHCEIADRGYELMGASCQTTE